MSYNSEQVLIKRRRRERRWQNRPRPALRLVQVLGVILLVFVAINTLMVGSAVGAVAGVYSYFARDLPDASAIETEQEEFETVRIYDRTGEHLLFESVDPRPFRGDRTYLPLEEMSSWVISATVGLEDRSFWQNPGINPIGLGRALVSTVRGGQVQGGSSITQQLIKQVIIDPEERYQRSYTRKIKEIIMALEITRRYSKEQILEWYLNYNFYGNFAYGIEAASQVYYNKPASDLTMEEAVMLSTIPQYPALNPFDNPQDAYRRQRKALDALVTEAGFLPQDEADAAKKFFDDGVLNQLFEQKLISETDRDTAATDKAASDRVLDALVQAEWIDQPTADAAKAYGGSRWMFLHKKTTERFENVSAPHFALYVLDELQRRFNTPEDPYYIWRNGVQVYTTLDYDLQKAAECAARVRIAGLEGTPGDQYVPPEGTPADACDAFKGMDTLPNLEDKDHNAHNAAVVAIRPTTGEILSMVGSVNYNNQDIDGEVNMAIADNQPGSSFKPFTYLEGFLQGYTTATRIMDVRTVFPNSAGAPYVPENYDRKYHGPQLARYALQRSYNIPAVWMMNQVGVKNVIDLAHKLGINSLQEEYYGLSLTLGGGDVRLLDMVYAYSVFANGGVMAGQPVAADRQRPGYRTLDPVSILQVRDKGGQILYEYKQPDTARLVDAQHIYLLQDVQSDYNARIASYGDWARFLELPDRKIAAKTGSTNNWTDGWTIGYAPQLAVGVWVGNADNTPMYEVPGSRGAAPIFRAVMQYALTDRGVPVEEFQRPPGIIERDVCWESGLLPTSACGRVVKEVFIEGTEPTQYDNVWRAFEINRANGKLATPYTPLDLREYRVYQIYPPEAADWVREQEIAQPPTEYDTTVGIGTVDGEAAIFSPTPFSYVKGTIEVRGNAQLDGFANYRVEYGSGITPDWYATIGSGSTPISGGALAYWNTYGLSGVYTLRVVVTRTDGSVKVGSFQVTVDNVSPTVAIEAPFEGDEYKTTDSESTVAEDDEWISITANANDDWAMDRVEFLLDGKDIGASRVPPFSLRWDLEIFGKEHGSGSTQQVPEIVQGKATGRNYTVFENGFGYLEDEKGDYSETHLIQIIAYDRAGNAAKSEKIRVYVHRKTEDKATPTP